MDYRTVDPVLYGTWINHWISCDDDLDGYCDGMFECSECLEVVDEQTTYCPSCYAKMEECRQMEF